MANLDDVVTVQKNGVVGVNALVASLDAFRQLYEAFVGNNTYLGAVDSSLVVTGSGRLVNVMVSAAAAGGTIHDASTVATATTSNVIFSIPNAVGITQVNMPFFNGLIIKPASTSSVSISYSQG